MPIKEKRVGTYRDNKGKVCNTIRLTVSCLTDKLFLCGFVRKTESYHAKKGKELASQ